LDAVARERGGNVLADRLATTGGKGQHAWSGAAQGNAKQAGALKKFERFGQAGH
jgi:hypothetical protein